MGLKMMLMSASIEFPATTKARKYSRDQRFNLFRTTAGPTLRLAVTPKRN